MRRFLLTVVVVLAGCAAEPQVRYEAPADTNTSIAIRKIELEGYLQKVLAKADRKSTRLNSSHIQKSRMPSSA